MCIGPGGVLATVTSSTTLRRSSRSDHRSARSSGWPRSRGRPHQPRRPAWRSVVTEVLDDVETGVADSAPRSSRRRRRTRGCGTTSVASRRSSGPEPSPRGWPGQALLSPSESRRLPGFDAPGQGFTELFSVRHFGRWAGQLSSEQRGGQLWSEPMPIQTRRRARHLRPRPPSPGRRRSRRRGPRVGLQIRSNATRPTSKLASRSACASTIPGPWHPASHGVGRRAVACSNRRNIA